MDTFKITKINQLQRKIRKIQNDSLNTNNKQNYRSVHFVTQANVFAAAVADIVLFSLLIDTKDSFI